MEYYPQLHRTASPASVESSDSRREEITLDSSVDGSTIYVLSSPPSASPTPTGPHLNIRSVRVAPSKWPGLTPREECTSNRTSAIPERSMDGMYESECMRSPPPQLFANTDECSIEVWDCTARDIRLDEYESVVLDEEILRASRWDLVPEPQPLGRTPQNTHFLRMHGRPLESRKPLAERTHAHAAQVFTRSRTVSPPPPVSHAPIRLPLLSFFASLLSIDDATLHLISHSPAHSALFPGPICPSDERGTRDSQETHGINTLLEASCQQRALRGGVAVACDESILPSNPFGLSMYPLAGLLDLVRGVYAEGRAALREVW
jgi:hypothetical protein